MPSDEAFEQHLAETPTRRLPAGALQQITDAVLAADAGPVDDAGPSPRWWSSRVPLWQAAAACLAVCLLTFLLPRADPAAETTPPHAAPATTEQLRRTSVASAFVSVDPSVFGTRHRPAYRTDISRWHPIPTTTD